MRVALLTNFVSPYRVPVMRDLARTPGWSLTLGVNAETEFDRSWAVQESGLDVRMIPTWSRRRRTRTKGAVRFEQVGTLHVPWGVGRMLDELQPGVVVSSELGPRSALAARWCRRTRTPLVLWSYHSRVSATTAGLAQRSWRRRLLRQADAVVGMGRQAREALQSLGVPAGRLFDAPNAHDEATCRSVVEEGDGVAMRARLEREHGVRRRLALCSGRLVPMKGVEALLAAWRRLPDDVRASWSLAFLGDGPLRDEVQRAAANEPAGAVVALGGCDARDAIAHAAAADLLVFPSLGDPWGLVVNEAMACGTPVLGSIHAGCADDLLRTGGGWTFDPTDGASFDRGLAQALAGWNDPRPSASARMAAGRCTPRWMAAGMRDAIRFASGSLAPADETPSVSLVGPLRRGMDEACGTASETAPAFAERNVPAR